MFLFLYIVVKCLCVLGCFSIIVCFRVIVDILCDLMP